MYASKCRYPFHPSPNLHASLVKSGPFPFETVLPSEETESFTSSSEAALRKDCKGIVDDVGWPGEEVVRDSAMGVGRAGLSNDPFSLLVSTICTPFCHRFRVAFRSSWKWHIRSYSVCL